MKISTNEFLEEIRKRAKCKDYIRLKGSYQTRYVTMKDINEVLEIFKERDRQNLRRFIRK